MVKNMVMSGKLLKHIEPSLKLGGFLRQQTLFFFKAKKQILN